MTDPTDQQVDELLARSAPPVSTTSPEVQHQVRLLVRATADSTPDQQVRRRRAGRRVVVGAGAAVVAFAGVSAAAASPSAPAWIAWADWTPDATVVQPPGCDLLGLQVVPDGAGPDDPGVVAASRYLATLYLRDVDYSQELVEQQESVVTLEDGTQLRGDEFRSADQLEYWAYWSAVTRMVHDEVERQGLDAGHVSIEGRADGCEPEVPR